MSRLALIAGGGRLPELICAGATLDRVVTMRDQSSAVTADFIGEFERLGALIDDLRGAGIRRICFAGAMRRPRLKWHRLDRFTLRQFPRIMRAMRQGDGVLLGFVRALFEAQGFEIIGAHHLLPELVAGTGSLGNTEPPTLDIDAALRAHRELGLADRGQALIMRDGAPLAREDRAGTAAMIAATSGAGGYLFKSSKPDQDLDFDMATIGPDTIDQIAAAGLDGVVIGAGRTLILDSDEVIRRADAAGKFVLGVPCA